MTASARGTANLTRILLLLGVVVGGIWIWKHLAIETQEYLVEHAVPFVVLGAGILGVVWAVARKLLARTARGRRRDRLMGQFERETAREARLDLAFSLIELNEYRLAGLERLAPAMKDLFVQSLKTAKGDKQHRLRGMAASHLGVLQDGEVAPVLLAALEDDHAYVRSCAALGLGRLRAAEAREKLTKVMEEDWDQTVRSRAREALERIG